MASDAERDRDTARLMPRRLDFDEGLTGAAHTTLEAVCRLGAAALGVGIFLGAVGFESQSTVAVAGAYLMAAGGIMVIHAGLIGAVVHDASRSREHVDAAAAPSRPPERVRGASADVDVTSVAPNGRPEELAAPLRDRVPLAEIEEYLRTHPNATLEEVARGVRTTAPVASDALETLARKRAATASGGRWSLR